MSNQPVYRYPPRSHAYNCPCPRCVQCRSRPSPGSDLMKFDMGCLGVVFLFAAVSGIVGWVARNGHAALEVLPAIGVLALIIWAVVFLNRRAVRPPKGRLRVEATTPEQLAPPPASITIPHPPCYHFDAVPVDLATGERVAWWCQACETQLDADFGRLVRPCCGSAPGSPHLYNCPHLTGDPR